MLTVKLSSVHPITKVSCDIVTSEPGQTPEVIDPMMTTVGTLRHMLNDGRITPSQVKRAYVIVDGTAAAKLKID